jgi:hypothetical protein
MAQQQHQQQHPHPHQYHTPGRTTDALHRAQKASFYFTTTAHKERGKQTPTALYSPPPLSASSSTSSSLPSPKVLYFIFFYSVQQQQKFITSSLPLHSTSLTLPLSPSILPSLFICFANDSPLYQSLSLSLSLSHTHTHTHFSIYLYLSLSISIFIPFRPFSPLHPFPFPLVPLFLSLHYNSLDSCPFFFLRPINLALFFFYPGTDLLECVY